MYTCTPLFPLVLCAGPLFWEGERVSWMSDCGARGEAEQKTSRLRHHLHCGSTWLQPGCSGGKTAQGEGRVLLLLLGVSAACFSVWWHGLIKFSHRQSSARLIPSHSFSFSLYSDRQAWSITLSRSITVFTASPCRMRFCVTLRSCRKSLNVWGRATRRLHSRGSSSSRIDKMLFR